MPQVYAIFAEESGCYYSHPELVKLFAIEAEAETFAQTLREMTSESCWEGEEPEPKYIQVEVKALTIS
ncbi:MAG: hypothetical protein EB145_13995 [Proteobacteria bacterium]|nr:hypothetical protein [Pseudomonadota bacterium]NBT20126.1 hypothetical protein [Pseudomonadota bacterium]NDF55278.1 hypothetical protein [Pseudomonadota bacterium]